MKKYVISCRAEAVMQVEADGKTVEEAKMDAIAQVRAHYPTADIRVLSVDAGPDGQ